MAWGSKTQISSAVTVNSTTLQDQSTAVTLNPGETAHIQVDADFPTTPTSNLEVHVLTTLDATTENWDDSRFGAPVIIVNSIDPHSRSFLVSGVYKFALIYKLDTGTNSVTVSAWYRKDGISL